MGVSQDSASPHTSHLARMGSRGDWKVLVNQRPLQVTETLLPYKMQTAQNVIWEEVYWSIGPFASYRDSTRHWPAMSTLHWLCMSLFTLTDRCRPHAEQLCAGHHCQGDPQQKRHWSKHWPNHNLQIVSSHHVCWPMIFAAKAQQVWNQCKHRNPSWRY